MQSLQGPYVHQLGIPLGLPLWDAWATDFCQIPPNLAPLHMEWCLILVGAMSEEDLYLTEARTPCAEGPGHMPVAWATALFP